MISRKILKLSLTLILIASLLEAGYCIVSLAKAENPTTFKTIGTVPAKIALYLGPHTIPAISTNYYCVFIQLQNSASYPAYAPSGGVSISLKSSNTVVGTVPNSATISAGKTFVRTYFTATTTTGTTVITASASGYATATATLTTVTASLPPSATKLVVYATPPRVLADDATASYSITVQLQDTSGNPAQAPSPGVTVQLSSSNTIIGTVTSPVTIPTGQTYAQATFDSTYSPGTTTIAAQAVGYTSGSRIMTTITPAPTKLVAYAAPPTLLADSQTYNNIYIQLQDAAGNPARAPVNIVVSLASSNATVGTIQSPITISRGSTFAQANFHTTYTSGSTTVTASAAGYTPTSVIVKTLSPSPAKLKVHPGPVLPSDGGWHYTSAVELQDPTGTPAKAPTGGVSVTLVSSNLTVGTVTSPISIAAGKTYAQISFKTTLAPGATTITATALGYTTGPATIKTDAAIGTPSKVVVQSVPPKLPAEGGTYNYPIVVQLQDLAGNPAKAPTGGVGVSLSSSDPSIGTVTSSLTISSGKTYSRTWFSATYTPGSATVKAAAAAYSAGSGIVTTTGARPEQLAVYAALPKTFADTYTYNSILVIQLQDVQGHPARAPSGGVSISLWSSNVQVGSVANAVTLSAGSTFIDTWFRSTYTPGSTSIVASVSMLLSTLSLSVTPKIVGIGSPLTISGQLWPKISTTLYLYYRRGTSAWSLATTIATDANGAYSITVNVPPISKGVYDLVMVWMGSNTYRGAVSETRSFTLV